MRNEASSQAGMQLTTDFFSLTPLGGVCRAASVLCVAHEKSILTYLTPSNSRLFLHLRILFVVATHFLQGIWIIQAVYKRNLVSFIGNFNNDHKLATFIASILVWECRHDSNSFQLTSKFFNSLLERLHHKSALLFLKIFKICNVKVSVLK